ncbi:MAG: mechanosensitive ion channel [Bacteroidetes bacterium]|nr:mechanosensitive ion channel [Bacteroidota bacterium]
MINRSTNKITKFLLLYFLSFFTILKAEEANQKKIKDAYSLKNPYETICTHLSFLEKENYRPYIAARAFMHEGVTTRDAKSYAVKLKEIYANEGIYVNIDTVPQAADYQDPVEKYNKYKITHIIPEIYLVKVGDKWLYSRETIHSIHRLYNKISRFKTNQFYKLFPKSWRKHIYNIAIWQYTTFVIAILFSIISYLVLFVILNQIFKLFLKLKDYTLALERYMAHVKAINKALTMAITIIIWLTFIRPALQLPIDVSRYTVSILKLSLYLSLSLLLYRLVDGISFFIRRAVVEERLDFQTDLLPLLKKVLKVCIIILGTLSILKALNFDVSAIIASLGLGSLGIALASQDAIKNLFGSVMIFIDKPFSVGDMIVTKDNIKGRVEEIGMRSTIIRTPEQTKLYVPNAILANTHIDNKGLNTYGNFTNQMSVSAKSKMDDVEEFVQGFRNILDRHPKIMKGESFVNIIDVNQGEYQILFSMFFNDVTYFKELMYRHEILVKVIKLGESLKLSFEIKKS